jgi:hypothetical protein
MSCPYCQIKNIAKLWKALMDIRSYLILCVNHIFLYYCSMDYHGIIFCSGLDTRDPLV